MAYGTQAPSLGIAEFAPAARQGLDAPPTTDDVDSARSGGGRRGRVSSTTTAVPTTVSSASSSVGASASPTTKVGRARQCFGDPPRQTEDPMSPSCAATIFEGDNGGATHTGVTATEIRVAFPSLDILGASPAYRKAADLLFDYINQRFEFYGRRVVPVYLAGSANDAQVSRAMAAEAAGQNVFAALTGVQEFQYHPQVAMIQELARRGIVTVVKNSSGWWTDSGLFDPFHPYVWSSYPSAEDYQTNVGDFACSSLANHKATHGSDATMRATTRKFAIAAIGQQVTPTTRILAGKLEECTGERPSVITWNQLGGAQADLRAGFERLRADGVTTVVCACEHKVAGLQAPAAASAVGFYPEWILPPLLVTNDHDEDMGQSRRTQFGNAPPIRFSAGPRLLPVQARPAYQAIASVDSGFLAADSFNIYAVLGITEPIYDQFLLLASGIQAAGPNLTPETFAQGLMNLQFPNPGAGQAPYWQPSVGFGPGDHSLFDDYQIGWWSDSAAALDAPVTSKPNGSWCYVNQGGRFTPGRYTAAIDDQLFNADLPCR